MIQRKNTQFIWGGDDKLQHYKTDTIQKKKKKQRSIKTNTEDNLAIST